MTRSLRFASALKWSAEAVRHGWQLFLAMSRLSLSAVCSESATLGRHDYHTYADDVDGVPWWTEGGGRCRRCGKWFRL